MFMTKGKQGRTALLLPGGGWSGPLGRALLALLDASARAAGLRLLRRLRADQFGGLGSADGAGGVLLRTGALHVEV